MRRNLKIVHLVGGLVYRLLLDRFSHCVINVCPRSVGNFSDSNSPAEIESETCSEMGDKAHTSDKVSLQKVPLSSQVEVSLRTLQ